MFPHYDSGWTDNFCNYGENNSKSIEIIRNNQNKELEKRLLQDIQNMKQRKLQ